MGNLAQTIRELCEQAVKYGKSEPMNIMNGNHVQYCRMLVSKWNSANPDKKLSANYSLGRFVVVRSSSFLDFSSMPTHEVQKIVKKGEEELMRRQRLNDHARFEQSVADEFPV